MPERRRPSFLGRFLSALGYLLFLVLALGVGTVFGWARRSSLISEIVRNPLAAINKDPVQAFGSNAENLLILGCDEDRYYHGTYLHGSNIIRKYARSDMMLLTRLDFDKNEIAAISIPRDTMCALPGWGRHKINAYHAIAPKGQENQLTQAAVEHLLPGVKVDKVIVLDFDAFQKLVDMVGGVDVDVPEAMSYDDNAGYLHIHLKPGFQHLNGYDAMGYVRFRHDREGDFGRQERQKELLLSFKQRALKNLFELPNLAEEGKAVLNYALNDDQILGLANFSRHVPPENIHMGTLPVLDGPGSFLRVDLSKRDSTLAQFGFLPNGNTRVSSLP